MACAARPIALSIVGCKRNSNCCFLAARSIVEKSNLLMTMQKSIRKIPLVAYLFVLLTATSFSRASYAEEPQGSRVIYMQGQPCAFADSNAMNPIGGNRFTQDSILINRGTALSSTIGTFRVLKDLLATVNCCKNKCNTCKPDHDISGKKYKISPADSWSFEGSIPVIGGASITYSQETAEVFAEVGATDKDDLTTEPRMIKKLFAVVARKVVRTRTPVVDGWCPSSSLTDLNGTATPSSLNTTVFTVVHDEFEYSAVKAEENTDCPRVQE